MTALLLLAAIKLAGVTGGELTTRAYFDVNNAKVGDPLVLTIDFIGEADFTALHPPALSRHVDRADWKVLLLKSITFVIYLFSLFNSAICINSFFFIGMKFFSVKSKF